VLLQAIYLKEDEPYSLFHGTTPRRINYPKLKEAS